jgi:hypothetical protein
MCFAQIILTFTEYLNCIITHISTENCVSYPVYRQKVRAYHLYGEEETQFSRLHTDNVVADICKGSYSKGQCQKIPRFFTGPNFLLLNME